MPILDFTPSNPTGQVLVKPNLAYLDSNDSYAIITSANYLNANQIKPKDFVMTTYGSNPTLFGIFVPSIVAGVVTLNPWVDSGNVRLPVVSGNIPIFSGTTGLMIDSGISPSDPTKTKVASVNGAAITGNILKSSDSNGTISDGGVAANEVLTSSIVSPDVSGNFIPFSVTCGFSALGSAGTITLINSSGSKQYRLINLYINKVGTNFSGGGGDRLGQVTDGTTVYSLIPATNMQTLVNAGWGISTPLPFPASVSINTLTAPGAHLLFSYSGGSADYTAGSIVVSGLVQRIV